MRSQNVRAVEIDPEELPDYDDMQTPEEWQDCADYYVEVRSDGDLLPIRTSLDDVDATKVLNAYTHHDGEVTVHHYYDLIGADLRTPGELKSEITRCWRMECSDEQDLESTEIGGVEVESDDNLMVKGIEARKQVQKQNRENGIGNQAGKNERTQGLKITANSCYGISGERVVDDLPLDIAKKMRVATHDVAGKYYNPHVASTLTAGGRLQLAMGESITRALGGAMYYCDTDSLVVDDDVVDDLKKAFENLNPYSGIAGEAEVLETESGKDADGNEVHIENCKFVAVNEKRYCFIKGGKIVKYTEHGLGHYKQLRDSEESPDKVRRWWATLLDKIGLSVHDDTLTREELDAPVTWQQSVSTKNIREILKNTLDEDVSYGDFCERAVVQEGTENIHYIGIDLIEEGGVCIRRDDDGTANIRKVDANEFAHEIKRVSDVLGKWQFTFYQDNARPRVRVDERRIVNKETSDIKKAFNDDLAEIPESEQWGEDLGWCEGVDWDLFTT